MIPSIGHIDNLLHMVSWAGPLTLWARSRGWSYIKPSFGAKRSTVWPNSAAKLWLEPPVALRADSIPMAHNDRAREPSGSTSSMYGDPSVSGKASVVHGIPGNKPLGSTANSKQSV